MTAVALKMREERRTRLAARARTTNGPKGAAFTAFVVLSTLCWAPNKLTAYAAPFAVVAVLLLKTRDSAAAGRLLMLIAAWSSFAAIHIWITPRFQIQALALSAITSASLLVLVGFPSSAVEGRTSAEVGRVAAGLLALEGGLGIGQAIYGFTRTGTFDLGNGDFVRGTMGLSLTPDRAMGNSMCAISLVGLIIIVAATYQGKHKRLVLCIGTLAVVLASVLHVTLFAVIAGIIAILAIRLPRQLRRVWPAGLAISIPLVLAFLFSPTQTSLINGYVAQFRNGASPKAEMYRRMLIVVPKDYPGVTLLGFGPGQFSSRAALISTGQYLGGIFSPTHLPLLSDATPGPTARYVMDVWEDAAPHSDYGSTQSPFSSWISFAVEYGIIASGALFICICYSCARTIKLSRQVSPSHQTLAIGCLAIILFLFFIGFQENYWELPQAVLTGIFAARLLFLELRRQAAGQPIGQKNRATIFLAANCEYVKHRLRHSLVCRG